MITKKCKNCNGEFTTRRSSKQHCSSRCFSEYRSNPEVNLHSVLKRKESTLKKYGVDNIAKLESIKEKAKFTCLRKYGVISPTQNSNIRQKQIDTCLKNYGVKNPQQNVEIRLKQQKSLYNKYGTIVPLKNKDILTKVKNTNLEKYGTDNVAKLEKSKEKVRKTNSLKYGVPFVSQYKDIREKQIKTRLITAYKYLISNKKFVDVIPLFSEEEYMGNVSYSKKYLFQCKLCGGKIEDTLLNGNIPRCHVCNPINRQLTENEIFKFIKELLPEETIKTNDRTMLNGKELDIYIPGRSLAIEYNGLYWHSETGGKKYKNYHMNKTLKSEFLNIRLIHIFEDEWLYKQKIVKSKLKHILKLNKDTAKIYARKCTLKVISSHDCNEFLENNHLQGRDNSSVRIGAYYKDELIAVMTFGSLRNALGSVSKANHWEMYRFCTSIDKHVIGMGGKLLSYFIKIYHPLHILSYADARWSINEDSNLYKSLGFKCLDRTFPNYWYLGKNYNKRFHRYGFRKHALKDKLPNYFPDLTEWENMKLNGYDRIWDCGNLKYIYELPNI